MTAIDLLIPQAEFLVFVFNLIIAVSLVCGLGLLAVRFLRSRSAPFRYSLLATSLFLVMFSPLIVLLFRLSGGSPLSVTISSRVSESKSTSNDSESPASFTVNHFPNKVELEETDIGEKRKHTKFSSQVETSVVAKNDSQKQKSDSDNSRNLQSTESPKVSRSVSVWQIAAGLILSIWIVGTLIVLAALIRGWLAVCKFRQSLHSPDDIRVHQLASRIARLMGLNQKLPVYESAKISVPVSLGLFRPAIVLPEDLGWELSDSQLESILLHETAHIVHRDHWVGLIGRIAAAMFWWHPLIHRINRRLADLREDICDNYVVQQQGNGREYAHVLVELAERSTLRPSLPVTIGLLENEFNGLENRVRRLLQNDRKTETRLSLSSMSGLVIFLFLMACSLFLSTVHAEYIGQTEVETEPLTTLTVKTRDEFIRAVRNAKPGTQILIAPGTYAGGLRFTNLQGEKGKPIILAAADAKNPPVISGGFSGLHFIDPAYLELHNLVITKSRANGLNIDDGGTYTTPAHHVVLKGLVVREIGSNRNHDGIKLSGLDHFRIENCTVKRWGKTGSGIDMVGCHNGVITGSTFREGDKIFGNAVQMKGGSRDVTVQFCRFENAGGRAVNIGGSTGLDYFRPKPQGYEAKNITVSDCTFIGSMAPVAFVGVDGAHVHHNTIYRPTRWILRILQENRNTTFVPCRNGRFTNNIVVFRSDELAYPVNIGSGTSPASFRFAKNFWYCMNRPEKTRRAIQLPTPEKNGTYGRDPQFVAANRGNFKLRKQSPVKDAGPRSGKK
ncbi:MAG: hypothetical protein Tsb009_05280 [Planctomycetaceae bacterium]